MPFIIPRRVLVRGAVTPVTLINRESGSTLVGTSGTNFTETGRAIGAASPTRRVIALIGFNSATNSRTLSSGTIGGISADIHVQDQRSNSGTTGAAIMSATVPTGTTATVVMNFSGTMNWCGVLLTAIDNLVSTTPVSVGSRNGTTSTSFSVTGIDWEADGFVCGVHMNGLTPSTTWTGLTEYRDTAESTRRVTMADEFKVSAATNQSISLSLSGSPSRSATCVASFR